MAIVPVRNLGQLGIITDVDPFDLPVNTFSFGKNIRFENNRVERGPVFRFIGPTTEAPRTLYGYQDSSNQTKALYGAQSGALYQWTPTSALPVSPSTYVSAKTDVPSQVVAVNGTLFVNREDHVPWYRSKDSSGAFAELPSGTGQWDPTWRAKAFRSVAGVLVALNLTKGSQSLPNDVLWSNFVPFNGTPDWNVGSTTGSAGENTLAEMKEPIIDGLELTTRLMIYANNETWTMEYIGGNAMFNFNRSFDKGIIARNCVVETNNVHYVFGSNDIWMHDGVSQKSIAQGRVRRFIFDSIRLSEKDLFFVSHNPSLNEIMFCYVSDDAYLAFPAGNSLGCNRAAVYNYAADTWSFVDLPYVTCADSLSVSAGATFDAEAIAWQTIGGSWSSQEGDTKRSFIMGSYQNDASQVTGGFRTYAPYSATTTTFTMDATATAGAYLERTGLDLDELKAELRGYKLCSSLYPQIRMSLDAEPLVFSLGSVDFASDVTEWGADQTYTRDFYKLDHNIAGRYLSYRMTQTDYLPFSMSGIDFDLVLLGSR